MGESLQDEVKMCEGKKKALQEQIQQLQEEKNQLEFILEAHKSVCSRVSSETALDVKPITTTEPRVLVKAEPDLQQSTVRHLTHAEAMEEQQAVTVTTTVRVAQKPKRPSSLLVGNGSNSLSSLNIPIETPTNVMNQLDFNALMDGRTGLTPTNILTPIMVNMTSSSSSSSKGRTGARCFKSLEVRTQEDIWYLCDVKRPLTPGSELEFKWKIMTPSPYVDYYYI